MVKPAQDVHQLVRETMDAQDVHQLVLESMENLDQGTNIRELQENLNINCIQASHRAPRGPKFKFLKDSKRSIAPK